MAGRDLCRGGTLILDPAAVVGHHDAAGPGLQGLQRAANGHDALDDEGLLGIVDDLPQLLHGLAAGGRRQPLQEGQARCVDVHGHGHGVRPAHGVQLGEHRFHVPGLHRGHAQAPGRAVMACSAPSITAGLVPSPVKAAMPAWAQEDTRMSL